jgi:hypothetical protein
MGRTIAAIILGASLVHAATSAQAPKTYTARLSVVPIDVTMQATIAGSGSVTAELKGTTLTITGTYKDLRSPATVVRLHRGPKGIRGPAVFDLKASGGTSGTISGTLTLSQQQVEDLGRSWFYVQLHSEKAPDGNLWGWLLVKE